MATTPNYGWPLPTVGADADNWGNDLNTALTDIDAQVKANAGNQLGFTPVQQGTGTGQGSNQIAIGYNSSKGGPTVQVDNNNFGLIVTEETAGAFLRVNGNSPSNPQVTTSTYGPSGGNSGDIWLQVI